MNKLVPFVLFALFFGSVKAVGQVNAQDSLALIDLYDSTNGAAWIRNTNWLTTEPLSNWYGITISGDRIFQVDLQDNNLSGAIPSSLGNLTGLQNLNLFDNRLTGKIPSSFSDLTNLQTLFLGRNQLSDSIPSFFGNLTNLVSLYLEQNRFSGNIPASLGNLHNLQTLELYDNKLSGPIPASLGNLTNLQQLFLNINQLSDTIPSSLGNLTNLQFFQLDHNRLTGRLPSSFGNFINATTLDFSYNKLGGGIPASIGGLTSLQFLIISNDKLTGTIPPSIGNLSNLLYLDLSGNLLTGSIPSELGNLKVHTLDLHNNRLSGSVPISLSAIPISNKLNLDSNRFTFEGIEQLAQIFSPTIFTYSPQDTIPLNYVNGKLSVSAGGILTDDIFQWYRNGVLFNTIAGDSTLTLTQSGVYSVGVTNAVATKLTLFSKTISANVLPVNFISFTVTTEKTSASLTWETATEYNSDYFAVERSTDGIHFNTINKLTAAGGSSSIKIYAYTDAGISDLQAGAVYYRIREVDKDGMATYSSIQMLKITHDNLFSVSPNPARDFISISSTGNFTDAQIRITDISGRMLYTFRQSFIPGQQLTIPTYKLSNGILILVIDGKDIHEQFKIVIE
jgi:Leucine-rich repeat (LRR) protein